MFKKKNRKEKKKSVLSSDYSPGERWIHVGCVACTVFSANYSLFRDSTSKKIIKIKVELILSTTTLDLTMTATCVEV